MNKKKPKEKNSITAKISTVLREISNAFSMRNFYLLGEHADQGYHGTSKEINILTNAGHLPEFQSKTNYKSQGKLFLVKLLLLLEEQKKSFSKNKYLTISRGEWDRLLYHYIEIRDKRKFKKYIKFWTNGQTGVLQKAYTKEKGKKTRVKDGYSLTPANSHIQRLFVGLGYDDKDVKDSASLKKLFEKDQNAPDILKGVLEYLPVWIDNPDRKKAA